MVEVEIHNTPAPVRLEELDLITLGREVKDMTSRLEDKDAFSQDLFYLRSRGIQQKRLATVLNTTVRNVRHWQEKKHLPKKLSHFLIIRRLAKCIREKEEAQREAGLKPQLVRS